MIKAPIMLDIVVEANFSAQQWLRVHVLKYFLQCNLDKFQLYNIQILPQIHVIPPGNGNYSLLPHTSRVSVLLHWQYPLQRTIQECGLHDLHVDMFDRGRATRQ